MRRRKIVTRTLLILFVINHWQIFNFVFGAPVAARERLEECIDMEGTEDGTAALQKRVNPVDEGSTNMAGQTPLSPDRTEVDQLWQELGEQGMLIDSPTPLNIPGWSTPLFSKGSSTESIGSNPTPPPSPPPPSSPPPPTPPPPTSPPPSLTLPEERLPPASSLTTDTPSTTGHQPTPQQSPGPDLDVHPPPNPGPHPPAMAEMPINAFLEMLMEGKIKRTFPAPVL